MPPKPPRLNHDHEKGAPAPTPDAARTNPITANTTSSPTSMPVMIHCALAVTVTPAITRPTMTRNHRAPTVVAAPVLFARSSLNSDRVREPAGRAPATMKMVAETTRDQPERKPSDGCSAG